MRIHGHNNILLCQDEYHIRVWLKQQRGWRNPSSYPGQYYLWRAKYEQR